MSHTKALNDAPIRDDLVDGKWTKLWAGFFADIVNTLRAFQNGEFYHVSDRIVANATATADHSAYIVFAQAGPITLSLPAAATMRNKRISIKKVDGSANAVTIDGFGSETIDSALTKVLTTQYASIDLIADPLTNEWWIF